MKKAIGGLALTGVLALTLACRPADQPGAHRRRARLDIKVERCELARQEQPVAHRSHVHLLRQ